MIELDATDASFATGGDKSGEKAAGWSKPAPQKPVETWKPSRLAANTSRLMVGDNEELPLRGMQVDVRDRRLPRPRGARPLLLQRPAAATGGQFPVAAAGGGLALFLRLRTDRLPGPAGPAGRFDVLQAGAGLRRGYDAGADSGHARARVGQRRRSPAWCPGRRRPSPIARRSAAASIRRWSSGPARASSSAASSPWPRSRCTAWSSATTWTCCEWATTSNCGSICPKRPRPASSISTSPRRSDHEVSLDAPAETSADGQRLSYRLIDPQQRPLVVRLREPAATMLIGGDGKTGSYFAVRLEPLGATAGLSSSAGNTVGQANRGTPELGPVGRERARRRSSWSMRR